MTQPPRAHSAGFTLMEVILVMIVSASMLFGGTVLYNTLRDNSGAAAAKARTSALQIVVEKLVSESATGDLPTAAELNAEWVRQRQDAASSPWGGPADCKDSPTMVPGSAPAGTCRDPGGNKLVFRDLQVCETGVNTRCFESARAQGDAGTLVYLHYTAASLLPDGTYRLPRRRDAYVSTYDHSQKAYVATSRYAIAAENPDGKQFYFVTGPTYVDRMTGQPASPSMVAGVSGTDCACSPFDAAGTVGP
ncbi:MAG: hypothetical protein FJZ01_14095 [Candidatus Sericytochromatia bacterium]|nr:hypothetical protein [Candidatus Tanganyikabacteria bacterium]